MLLRPALLAIACLGLALLAVGSSSGATRATAGDELTGEWTPDTSSASQLQGHAFYVAAADSGTATSAVSPTLLPSYEAYCTTAKAGSPITYFTLSYTWGTAAKMGGCLSPKTGTHAYFWGADSDVAYVHPVTLRGEPVLEGAWGLENQSNSVSYEKLTAHRPIARFLTKVKYLSVGKKGGKIAELITATGAGKLTLSDKPLNCVSTDVFDGAGAITLKIVKVGGPNLVELDDVAVKIEPTVGSYSACDTQEIIKAIPVVVKAADPAEKDACPVGSHGSLYLTDRSAKYGSDSFALEVAKCRVAVSLSQAKAKKGSHVAVAVTLDENGY
jgi:hypothetical protein